MDRRAPRISLLPAAALVLALAGSVLALGGDLPPAESGHREEPKNGRFETCREIDLSRAEAWTGSRWLRPGVDPGVHVDRIGRDTREEDEPVPLRLVLFFDEVHLALVRCAPRAAAYSKARDLVRGGFRPEWGDRLLIVSWWGGSPGMESAWLSDRGEALALLDEMEARRPPPSTTAPWIPHLVADPAALGEAIEELSHAVSSGAPDQPTTHVIVLAGDVPVDAAAAEELRHAADRIAANRVVVHTIDLRPPWVPGSDYGLGSLAWNLGGHRWPRGSTLVEAIRELRAVVREGCRLLVTVPVPEGGRVEEFRLDLHDPRFRVESLASRGAPIPDLAEKRAAARRLLPEWGDGIHLDARLWPLRKTRRGEVACALVLRVRLDGDAPEVPHLRLGLSVEGGRIVLRDPPREIDTLARRYDGERLRRLRRNGRALELYELRARPGRRLAVRAVVETPDGSAGASRQLELSAPRAPAWALLEGFARPDGPTDLLPAVRLPGSRESAIPVPAPPGTPAAGGEVRLAGWGCPATDRPTGLLASPGRPDVTVVLHPLGRRDRRGCGFFLGAVAGLPPGNWTFRPGDAFPGRQRIPLRFAVPAREAALAAPRPGR